MKLQVRMDEKPTIVTTDIPEAVKSSGEKKPMNMKYIALAVASVCIVVAIIAGFVFAFKFHSETTAQVGKTMHEMVKDHKSDDNLDEDVEVDKVDDSKLYTVRTNGEIFYVLEDPRRNLRLVKRDGNCFLSPESTDEKANNFIIDKDPIEDKTMLSERGQELCKDEPVFWAMPACDDEQQATSNNSQPAEKDAGEDVHEREKRQIQTTACYCTPKCLTCPIAPAITCYFPRGYCIYVIYFHQYIWPNWKRPVCLWYRKVNILC